MATVLPKPPIRTPAATIANLRWYICGLLFFATTVNYIDRQVLGLLKPVLEKELGWTESKLRMDRLRVSARLRDDDAPRGPGHRLSGHAAWVLDRGDRVEHRRGGSCAGRQRARFRSGSICPGLRRIGEFSCRAQDRGCLVPAARARSGHRHFQ